MLLLQPLHLGQSLFIREFTLRSSSRLDDRLIRYRFFIRSRDLEWLEVDVEGGDLRERETVEVD